MTAVTAGRRSRLSAPVLATWSLGALVIFLCAAKVPLDLASHWAGSGLGVQLVAFAVLLPVTLVGLVVAGRQPGNPLGWMFLALVALTALGGVGADYAWLSYGLGHHLPLGVVAVFLAPSWWLLLVTFPLMILLFPDGRLPSRRWRPVLWGYLAVGASWPLSIYAVTISAVAAGDRHVAPGGDLRTVDDPAGSSAWLGSAEAVILAVRAISGWCSSPVRCTPGAARTASAASSSSG